MPTTLTHTFDINQPSVALNSGEKLIFKFVLTGATTSNYTASFSSAGSLRVSSLSTATGYNAISDCPFIIALPKRNEIALGTNLSSLHDTGYIFAPNPAGLPESTLYNIYGDVDYPFSLKLFDIVLIYLSDGTYVEYRIIKIYTQNGLVYLTLDKEISNTIKEEINTSLVSRVILLSRREDETNAYVIYPKRSGKTSYGFIIPQNLAPDMLENIDTITRQVKQKLVNEQSG